MVEERVQRRLAAILAADVVGFSRLMEKDEAGTLAALKHCRAELIDPAIAAHNGRIVKLMGDGTLVEFASVVDAVQCAAAIQQGTAERNSGVPQDRRLEFRIGVNLGDVILDGGDIYGDGVNVAARLESLAEPGGICISGAVHDAIKNRLTVRFEFLGEQAVKNIATPLRAYRAAKQPESPVACSRPPDATAPTAPARHSKPSLAVKPFENISGDPEQDALADGLTNGLMVPLAKISGLMLIEDNSPSLSKSKQMTVAELGNRFQVQYVLKGGVRKYGEKVRVNAELVAVSRGHVLWAEQFDRNLRDPGDLFVIEDEITEEIVTALDVKLLTGEVARITRNALKNAAARECVYRGEELLWSATTRVEIREAQRLFEEVMRLEPTSPIGYAEASLAHWSEVLAELSDRPSEALERATELARQAIGLDDTTGYGFLVLAHVHLNKRNYDEAMANADRAVLTRPSCPASYALKAGALTYLGRSAEAVEVAEFAVRLTPVQPPIYPAILASAYYGCARHEEAIAAARAAIDLNEQDIDPHLILTASNVALGRSEEARSAAQKVRLLKPDFDLTAFAASQPYKDPNVLDELLTRLRSAGLA